MSVTQSGFGRTVATAVIPGAAAGNLKCPGIRAGDTIIAVTAMTNANPPVPTDRTADASIPASTSDTIAMGGATTAGAFLAVTWAKAQ